MRQGLCTQSYLSCESCSSLAPISFLMVGTTKVLKVNLKAVFGNKCSRGSCSSFQMLCGMLDLPPPLSRNVYAEHAKAIREQCILQAETSFKQAREEVRKHYNVSSPDEVPNILVSCDGKGDSRRFLEQCL